MKKIYSFIASLFLISSLYSQKIEKENVPAVVTKQFETANPTAKNVKWELDFENYQVDFMNGKDEKSIWYDKDGNWLKKITILKSTALPKTVRETLSKELGGLLSHYTYQLIEKVEIPSKDVHYKITVKKNEEAQVFFITENGELLKNDDQEEQE